MRILSVKVIAIAISILFVSCGNDSSTNADGTLNSDIVNNPASADSPEPDADKLPEFTFDHIEHDFGKIAQGEKVNHSFKFKNDGNTDLIISSAAGSCGCTVPSFPKEPIKAGQEGVIDVVFNSEGKTGIQRVTVTVVANTVPNTKVLTLTGEVLTK